MSFAENTVGADYLYPALRGAAAGSAGTIPMTLFMLGAHQFLPRRQRSSLPPRKLTMHVAKWIGLREHMSDRQRRGATWTAHFAYGAASGALYGPLARKIPGPSAIKGTAFGLVVWTASYLAGVPALQMPEAAKDQPWRRNALMIGAHVVWGSVTAVVLDLLGSRGTSAADLRGS